MAGQHIPLSSDKHVSLSLSFFRPLSPSSQAAEAASGAWAELYIVQ